MDRLELIPGDIYVQNYSAFYFIFEYEERGYNCIGYTSYLEIHTKKLKDNLYFHFNTKSQNGTDYNTVEQATEEQKIWLSECIKQGKLVSLEDSLMLNNPIDLISINNIINELDGL